MVATGPMMVAGPELAQAASQALGAKMEFESITECVPFSPTFAYCADAASPRREKAKEILSSEQGAEVDDGRWLLDQMSAEREMLTGFVQRRRSICSSTIHSYARARRTTSRTRRSRRFSATAAKSYLTSSRSTLCVTFAPHLEQPGLPFRGMDANGPHAGGV